MYVTTSEATGWAGQHPDIFQTWGGPSWLRIDKVTGYSPYQGMFFQPLAYDSTAAILGASLRRINIVALPQSPNTEMGLPFQFVHDFPIEAYQVYGAQVAHNPPGVVAYYAGADKLAGMDIKYGTPPGGDFVPSGTPGVGVPGIGYVSPGYLS
jgi:hypothetical protein